MKLSIVVALALCATSCDVDGAKHGARTPCATSTGELIGCPDVAINTEWDACFRMVDCGAIPVEAEEDFIFDLDNCVRFLETRDANERDYLLSCVAVASCDELKDDGSPERPGPPTCFAFNIDPRPDQP